MPPPFATLQRLSATCGQVCATLIQCNPRIRRDPQWNWNELLDKWTSGIANEFKHSWSRWSPPQRDEVLVALEELVPAIQQAAILGPPWVVENLIQPRDLRDYPTKPLPRFVELPHPATRNARHSHLPSTPSLHGFPSTSPPSFPHPGLAGHSMLQQAAGMFNTGFSPQPQIVHQSPQQWQTPNFARPTEDDLSYFVEIFPLFSPIRVAWERFVQFRCPEGERNGLFEMFNEWEREVKEYVPQVWAIWGMGRTQSKELLDLLLKHLRDGTFHVLPPIELFEMLPCLSETFAVLTSQLATPAVPHTASSTQGSPCHNSNRSNLVLFYHQYKHEMQQLLHSNPHLLPTGHHQPQQHSPYHLPPHPDPNEHNMQELARWHRRMTDRQAKRYGTSSRAFEAGL